MSLEAALAENTAAVHKLIAVMQSAALPAAGAEQPTTAGTPAPAPAATGKATRAKKDPAVPEGSGVQPGEPNDGKRVSMFLQPGDPEGTRYFHVEQYRTVAAIKPGEMIPDLPGITEIPGTVYTSLKSQYAAPVPPSSGAAVTGGAAATPASATPAASTASSNAQGTSPQGAVDGPALLNKCKELHGHLGNDALAAVLAKFITEANGFAKGATVNVPNLVGRAEVHAAAAADIDKLMALPKGSDKVAIDAALAPAAAAGANLFG